MFGGCLDSLSSKGQIQLTWTQVKIGIQSSFIVFPVNLLIVGIFRHSRPRKKKTKKQKAQKQPEPPQKEKEIPYETFSPHVENDLTEDFIINVSPPCLINYAHYLSLNKKYIIFQQFS